MEEKDKKVELQKVSLFEFRYNLGLLLDTRYNPMGLQVSHIEKEYSFWFTKCQGVSLERLETHEKSWIGLFKNDILLKDRFFVVTKNGAQYVRSNPDKLSEESKELFDFANYKELQLRKQRSDEKKSDVEVQTDFKCPNCINANVVKDQDQVPTYHQSMYRGFMPETPVTPPQDDDPKTATTTDLASPIDEQNGRRFSIGYGYDLVSPASNSQHSTDSASTDFLEDEVSGKVNEGFRKQRRARSREIVKIKKEPHDVVTPVKLDFKIEPEELPDDGDVLENTPPIDHMDPFPSPADTQQRVESDSHYSYDYEHGNAKSPPGLNLSQGQIFEGQGQIFEGQGQIFEGQDLPPEDYAEPVPSNTLHTKRKLESTSHYSGDYDDYETTAKSPRYYAHQTFEEDLPTDDDIEPGPSSTTSPRTRILESTSSLYSDYDDYYTPVTQNEQLGLPSDDCSTKFGHQADQFPKPIQGSILTEIKMDEYLLKELTELVKGIRSVKRLKGSSPKSAVKDRWVVFPIQDIGLGIYLSDRDGTPFFWNAERWDPNVQTPQPHYHRRPLSLKLPPNSLIYGEFVQVNCTYGKAFTEFNVIDIAALQGNILKEGFNQRRAICVSYLNDTQKCQRQPKIYMGMKPVVPLPEVKNWNILRGSFVREGAFHLNRRKTFLEITGIGLCQNCSSRKMLGWSGFAFSMNQRYVLQAPDPSSKPSLENYVLQELSKVFKDLDS